MSDVDVTLSSKNPEETLEMADVLASLYSSDFVDPPDKGTPFYSEERFHERLGNYAKLPNFRTIVAATGSEVIGFVYGCSLRVNTSWWDALITPLPESTTKEDGHRTYAIFDMLVAKTWRGQRISSRLHRMLLEDRPEERVTLLSSEPQQPAYSIWLHWGYEIIGKAKPMEDGPVLDVFVRSLPLTS